MMIVQIVRFKSALSEEQVFEAFKERAPEYRALKGLVHKYYLKFPDTNEYGGVYIWESQKAIDEFRESPLALTMAKTYEIQGESQVESAELVLDLRHS